LGQTWCLWSFCFKKRAGDKRDEERVKRYDEWGDDIERKVTELFIDDRE
tara:strand:- start:182 stop:328 length:147 start_codon:yes stop_codon:yes gene_type:complete